MKANMETDGRIRLGANKNGAEAADVPPIQMDNKEIVEVSLVMAKSRRLSNSMLHSVERRQKISKRLLELNKN